ncbi:MAG: hypothetical protein KA244_09540, partial [Deltaproteobacteria bacterium]|nr:hypothetical protein [Deltaproteobacteria bacterium]
MATQRGVSISVKMIATSLLLVLSIVGLLGYTSTYYSRKAFDDAAHRLSEAYDSALESRAQVMTQTMAETVRPALIQNDWSNLKTLVPESAKSDSDVVALYIIADTSIVA